MTASIGGIRRYLELSQVDWDAELAKADRPAHAYELDFKVADRVHQHADDRAVVDVPVLVGEVVKTLRQLASDLHFLGVGVYRDVLRRVGHGSPFGVSDVLQRVEGAGGPSSAFGPPAETGVS